MVIRNHLVEVISKQEGQMGYCLLVLRPPSDPPDYNRPWWVQANEYGGPMTLSVTKEEADSVEIGDIFGIHLAPVDPDPIS